MLHLLYALVATARSSLKPQRELALENLALRQQLAIVQRKTTRPKLSKADRAFWVALCRLWPDWQNALLIVKPQTVIGWHRKGFKLYWTWKSWHRTGRPPIDARVPGSSASRRASHGPRSGFEHSCRELHAPKKIWRTKSAGFARGYDEPANAGRKRPAASTQGARSGPSAGPLDVRLDHLPFRAPMFRPSRVTGTEWRRPPSPGLA